MTTLVIRIGDHDGDDAVVYHRPEHFPVTLGRGFGNDIILPDPHASARHAEIFHDGTGWVLRDLGSENGVLIAGAWIRGAVARLTSGEEFMLGRTPVAVFDPQHPVPAAEKLEQTHPFIAHIAGGILPWLYFTLAITAIGLMDYLDFWTENAAAQVAKTAGGIALGILIWALPWSVAGRLIRHRSAFRAHVAMVSLCLLAATLLWPLQDLLNFLTSENLFATTCEYLLNAVLIAGLIYGSLALATHMTARRRALAAGFFTVGVMGSLLALGYLGGDAFTPQPQYAVGLEPYFHNLPPADGIDDFLARAQRLTEDNIKPLK
ncbi:MAG: FHA domain-containing protein [Alphaproteobacteria bacterium]|nr:FHA domain-containing protein [Alphaproteobacteria bacterium]